MSDQLLKMFETAKALVDYIDKEYVFDRSADMGCGGYDTYQSEQFYNFIADARKALSDFERVLKNSEENENIGG